MRSPLVLKPLAPSGVVYLADNSPYISDSRPRDDKKTIITGAFPVEPNDAEIVETIRDPNDPNRLLFLEWKDGTARIHTHVVRSGKTFVPVDPNLKNFPSLSLPDRLSPDVESALLREQIAATISQFVELSPEKLLIVVSIILVSWFPDCFTAMPYLYIVGPLNSGKTTLLKLLWCFCRRGLLAGDLRSASLYKLMDAWQPTLLIDELETGSSRADGELSRLLRTGSTPGIPAMRDGQPFATYGLKIISSRQPPSDAALLSRGLIISMLPTDEQLTLLDDATVQRIAKEFQPKLLTFRLTNRPAVRDFSLPLQVLPGPSRRIKQIAHALSAPLLGDESSTAKLVAILLEVEEEASAERSLEPEWLVAFTLFDMCHDNLRHLGLGATIREIHVGALAARINQKLQSHGEDLRLTARKVGAVLKSLDLRTELLNRSGRGMKFTSALKIRIHDLARQLGIDRRTIAFSGGLDAGYGGVPCPLCDRLGLAAGLKFCDNRPLPALVQQAPAKSRFFLRDE